MKKLLALSSFLISLSMFAQYTPQEVKKFKITKLTTVGQDKGAEAFQKDELWYDEFGNDTAEYNNGQLNRRTKYEYNSKGQLMTRTRYGADGKETDTAIFNYNPDGSYVISNTDKSFGMTDLTYCDKTGKTLKTIAPDKSEKIHMYDTRGKLLKIKSNTSGNGSVITDIHYDYNPKGQMIKEMSKGDYKWTRVFTYDYRGLIAKVIRDSVTDGVVDPEVTYVYEYEFRK